MSKFVAIPLLLVLVALLAIGISKHKRPILIDGDAVLRDELLRLNED